jgi:NADPH:quinone reductase-like Zn-dependent oxidoreductase
LVAEALRVVSGVLKMKAVVQEAYGSADVLHLRDLDRPAVGEADVLVRVHAAGLNAGDHFVVRGGAVIRLVRGLRKPRDSFVPGWDLAGRVTAIGGSVTRLRVGDEVFGQCDHACAEYVSARQERFVTKPADLSFEEAAAVPMAAATALRALRDIGKVGPGQRVLINGASGGVGTFAVQIAKWLGAEVTGVCSTRNVALVRSLGADHVIDYTQEDFAQVGSRYDLILDNVGSRSFSDCRRALLPRGRLIPNTGHAGMGYVVKAFALSAVSRQVARPFLGTPTNEDLVVLKGLLESGKLRPVIDRTYAFTETPTAMAYLGLGHACGKVLITVHADAAHRL